MIRFTSWLNIFLFNRCWWWRVDILIRFSSLFSILIFVRCCCYRFCLFFRWVKWLNSWYFIFNSSQLLFIGIDLLIFSYFRLGTFFTKRFHGCVLLCVLFEPFSNLVKPYIESFFCSLVPTHLKLVNSEQSSLHIISIEVASELFKSHWHFLSAILPCVVHKISVLIKSEFICIFSKLDPVDLGLNIFTSWNSSGSGKEYGWKNY